MITSANFKGPLVKTCSLEGETRDLGITAAHPNACQLSSDKWMLLYSTRACAGVDDDRSIIYQIRQGSITGSLIKEGHISRGITDWDAFGDGRKFVRQHGHIVVLGLPKGAKINGKVPEHANVFKAMWRCKARYMDPETGIVKFSAEHYDNDAELRDIENNSQRVEYVHFKLNDKEDDIEFLHEPRRLKQVGFEDAEQCCEMPGSEKINRTFTAPAPYNNEADSWVDMIHFRSGQCDDVESGMFGCVNAIKHKFNPQTGLYDWTDTSKVLSDSRLFEASIARNKNGFMISSRVQINRRKTKELARCWHFCEDPFNDEMQVKIEPWPSNVPMTFYSCPDGEFRLFTGNADDSPYKSGRGPIYCWSMDEKGKLSEQTLLVDAVKEKLLPNEERTGNICTDFPKLVVHAGGNKQTVLFRFKTYNLIFPIGSVPPVTDEQLDAYGIYYSEIEYDQSFDPYWSF
ncbi:MAG: hypothetical protein ACYTFY_13850 [Planctomycetota bacterium]|jgi:hypothetical protein